MKNWKFIEKIVNKHNFELEIMFGTDRTTLYFYDKDSIDVNGHVRKIPYEYFYGKSNDKSFLGTINFDDGGMSYFNFYRDVYCIIYDHFVNHNSTTEEEIPHIWDILIKNFNEQIFNSYKKFFEYNYRLLNDFDIQKLFFPNFHLLFEMTNLILNGKRELSEDGKYYRRYKSVVLSSFIPTKYNNNKLTLIEIEITSVVY